MDFRHARPFQGFAGAFDFLYVPLCFKEKLSLCYAFINFVNIEAAERFWKRFHGFQEWGVPCRQVGEVCWCERHQGLSSIIQYYRNNSVMHPDVPDECKPILLIADQRAPFPPPTKKIKLPKKAKADGNEAARSGCSSGVARGLFACCKSFCPIQRLCRHHYAVLLKKQAEMLDTISILSKLPKKTTPIFREAAVVQNMVNLSFKVSRNPIPVCFFPFFQTVVQHFESCHQLRMFPHGPGLFFASPRFQSNPPPELLGTEDVLLGQGMLIVLSSEGLLSSCLQKLGEEFGRSAPTLVFVLSFQKELAPCVFGVSHSNSFPKSPSCLYPSEAIQVFGLWTTSAPDTDALGVFFLRAGWKRAANKEPGNPEFCKDMCVRTQRTLGVTLF